MLRLKMDFCVGRADLVRSMSAFKRKEELLQIYGKTRPFQFVLVIVLKPPSINTNEQI